MKKTIFTLLSLALTAALVLFLPQAIRPEAEAAPRKNVVLRVWVTEREPAVTAWMKKRAAAYEKAGGQRIYLRSATEQEVSGALSGEANAVLPDLLIGSGETPIALRGYALIVRDDTAVVTTPAPTAALFFRPSPSPGPTAEPPILPDISAIGAVLAPAELAHALPGTVESADPLKDFAAGKAQSALLTAGQAAQLTTGFQAYPLPDGQGLLPVHARVFSPSGQVFLSFLQTKDSQNALTAHGLYATSSRLYAADDPIRFLIDSSRME
ncbi:MAG: hypothetical protein IJ189_09015 [Clostridia bacterium]|nr:hypothetical protein [Clostridia bacterium]